MSNRSERLGANRVTNPTSYFLEWKSNDNEFEYYDRVAKEKKRVQLPFTITLLDEKHTVIGFHPTLKKGIYANEVGKYDLRKKPMTVKVGNEVLLSGIFADIKDQVNAKSFGGDYARSLYGVGVINGEECLINIKLKKTAAASWGSFADIAKKKFVSHEIVIPTSRSEKNGTVKYSVPVFTLGEEIKNLSVIEEFDDILDAYFKGLGTSTREEDANNDHEGANAYVPIEEQTAEPVYVGEGEDELPF